MGQVDKQFWRKYYCFENLIWQISYKETNQRWTEWTQLMFIICIADRREKLATPWGGIPVWEGFPAPFPREASFKMESNSVLLEVKISYESGCLVVGRWVVKRWVFTLPCSYRSTCFTCASGTSSNEAASGIHSTARRPRSSVASTSAPNFSKTLKKWQYKCDWRSAT